MATRRVKEGVGLIRDGSGQVKDFGAKLCDREGAEESRGSGLFYETVPADMRRA